MNEEKYTEDQTTHDAEIGSAVSDAGQREELSEDDYREQYRKLPMWKQVILLVLMLGAMTAVIMLINFVVEFGSELIKALVR